MMMMMMMMIYNGGLSRQVARPTVTDAEWQTSFRPGVAEQRANVRCRMNSGRPMGRLMVANQGADLGWRVKVGRPSDRIRKACLLQAACQIFKSCIFYRWNPIFNFFDWNPIVSYRVVLQVSSIFIID